MTAIRSTIIITLAVLVCLTSACSKLTSDKQKARQVIDVGLIKNASCKSVPVDVPVSKDVLENSAVLVQLVNQGYVVSAEITSNKGHNKKVSGYTFTGKGRELVKTAASVDSWNTRYPCIKMGHYKVKTVEAIDGGTTSEGLNVANVRTTNEFVPEEWLKATRQLPEWADYWKAIQSNESKQWMYRLGKSGDELFFGGMGQAI